MEGEQEPRKASSFAANGLPGVSRVGLSLSGRKLEELD